MNQDKIKQAFEAWFKKTDAISLKGTMCEMGIVWLACAQWLMSQVSPDLLETLDPDLYTCPNCDHQSPARATEIIELARLSCAKELAEKDARIKALEELLKECVRFNCFSMLPNYGTLEQKKLIAELARKKEGGV